MWLNNDTLTETLHTTNAEEQGGGLQVTTQEHSNCGNTNTELQVHTLGI